MLLVFILGQVGPCRLKSPQFLIEKKTLKPFNLIFNLLSVNFLMELLSRGPSDIDFVPHPILEFWPRSKVEDDATVNLFTRGFIRKLEKCYRRS